MNKIVVKDSEVYGSVVGGDQHNATYIVAAAPDPYAIKAGLDRIGALSAGDEEFEDFVELLQLLPF